MTEELGTTILGQMKKFNTAESEKLSEAKRQEVKEFCEFFEKVQRDPCYLPLLSEVSKLDVSDLKVSTDAHGSLDAMLAPMLASGAFKTEKENIKMGYVKIGDFLGDDDITLLTQDGFNELSAEQQLEYFPIFDLDFSDNNESFVFNGDALDGGRFSINVFLTYLHLLRKQDKLIKTGTPKKKKFFFNFGNHELFALFNMSAAFSKRCEAMLPGFALNFLDEFAPTTQKKLLNDRREFYCGLIRDIIRKNFNLFDFCMCQKVGAEDIRISHSIILKNILEGILGKILTISEKQKNEFLKCREGDYVDYDTLNTLLKSFISGILEKNMYIGRYSALCGLVMANKRDDYTSEFSINLEGLDKETYELTEQEKKLLYLVGHVIYDSTSFENVCNCIVPMDFGASSEYKSSPLYNPRVESCPRLTVITSNGRETIQIPLPVLGVEFKESKTGFWTFYEFGGVMRGDSNINIKSFQDPESFMRELKEKFGLDRKPTTKEKASCYTEAKLYLPPTEDEAGKEPEESDKKRPRAETESETEPDKKRPRAETKPETEPDKKRPRAETESETEPDEKRPRVETLTASRQKEYDSTGNSLGA